MIIFLAKKINVILPLAYKNVFVPIDYIKIISYFKGALEWERRLPVTVRRDCELNILACNGNMVQDNK